MQDPAGDPSQELISDSGIVAAGRRQGFFSFPLLDGSPPFYPARMKPSPYLYVGVGLLCLGSCATARRSALAGGAAAAGAAVGLLGGPVGAIGGAFIGGVAGDAVGTSDGFESGKIVGEDALTKQRAREFETLRTALDALGARVDDASKAAKAAIQIADTARYAADQHWWTKTIWQLIRGVS